MRQVFHTPRKVIVTCNKRLSPYLEQEIRSLGFTPIRVFPTGAELLASVSDCITLNLNLRCASQVLYSLAAFTAADASELYQQTTALPWEELIDFSGYFSVTSHVNNDTISTPLFANLKVKDAIADRIKLRKGLRPDSGPELRKTVIHLYWQDSSAELFADTSGETLAKHGYRRLPGRAPMLEALASGILYAAEWDGATAFINPMCGSGTLAIEAALMAGNRRPGLLRMNYAFMHLLGYDEQVFLAERQKLKEQIIRKLPSRIVASDISGEAIKTAIQNAKTAGVDHLIEFRQCDFAETPVPEAPGTVIFNPEYGQRLGRTDELADTYRRMGDFMKQRCNGYTGFVFTANPDLAKLIGLKASRKTEFYNGKLDCRLLRYELYEGSRRVSRAEGA